MGCISRFAPNSFLIILNEKESPMAQVTLKGSPVKVDGTLPQPGQRAPAFRLVDSDLADVDLKRFAGKRKVLNIVPSIDTPIRSNTFL